MRAILLMLALSGCSSGGVAGESCTQAVCSLDGSNVVQPPVLQGEPPPSTPEPLPPT